MNPTEPGTSPALSADHEALVDAFIAQHDFPLDPFQVEACQTVAGGRGTLVCAPTGAGKTIVGEFAVFLALATGTKCFYTTPIKALSNQKYHDLVAAHGEENVGLLTGDVSLNGDADIVVMTTEVLRNMIYAASPALERLAYVVMDEIHYLADKSRGAVWEEVILNLSEDVRIIGLSATVSNAEEFGEWLSTVRGDTHVIVTEHRPIPLRQFLQVKSNTIPLFAPGSAPTDGDGVGENASPGAGEDSAGESSVNGAGDAANCDAGAGAGADTNGADSLDADAQADSEAEDAQEDSTPAWEINPAITKAVARLEEALAGGAPRDSRQGSFRRNTKKDDSRSRAPEPDKLKPHERMRMLKAATLPRPAIISQLQATNMLPAIFFIFSRNGCDKALNDAARSKMVLTTQEEERRIAAIVDQGVESIPPEDLEVLGFRRWRSTLMRGFAAHHAGMLPAFRHIVEELFVKGLVKVVFATETLALGINMPARTVVIERLVKYDGEGFVDLTPGQYTQLTGRAGRRGIDTIGNAVVIWEPGVDPEAVAGLASTRTYPLNSTFQPGYNMTINLLANLGYTHGRGLIEKSFAQFQSNRDIVADARALEKARLELTRTEGLLTAALHSELGVDTEVTPSMFRHYMQLRLEFNRVQKADKKRAIAHRAKETKVLVRRLNPGDVIALPGRKAPVIAAVLRVIDSHDPGVMMITSNGWWGITAASEMPRPPLVVGHIHLQQRVIRQPRRHYAEVAANLRRNHYEVPKKLKPTTRSKPSAKAVALAAEIKKHPAHALRDADHLARLAEQHDRARRTVDSLATRVHDAQFSLAATFDDIIDVLHHLGYLAPQDNQPTAEHPDAAISAGGAGPRRLTLDASNAPMPDEPGTPLPEDLSTLVPTEEGLRLAHIHHQSDLLIAQCLRRGVWDGLDPAELAAAVSQCTFESRKETIARYQECAATDALEEAFARTTALWEELVWEETSRNLPPTRQPDAGFALAIHQWTAGAPLGYALAAAAETAGPMTPGDFVRQCRQVVDALDQVADTAYSDQLARRARQAREAIRRGVVALGM